MVVAKDPGAERVASEDTFPSITRAARSRRLVNIMISIPMKVWLVPHRIDRMMACNARWPSMHSRFLSSELAEHGLRYYKAR